jgi:hypothetical protein
MGMLLLDVCYLLPLKVVKYKSTTTLTPTTDNTRITTCDFITLFQLQRLDSTQLDGKMGIIIDEWEEMVTVYLKVLSLGDSENNHKKRHLSQTRFKLCTFQTQI